jgi:hypothetical protein
MSKRHKRTLRKLAMPLIALGLMTLMMSIGASTRDGSGARAPGAAQAADIYQR